MIIDNHVSTFHFYTRIRILTFYVRASSFKIWLNLKYSEKGITCGRIVFFGFVVKKVVKSV